MRFEVLCRGLDLRGKRILDIGCGLGDFVPWAEGKFGPDFDYLGMDLSEGLVKVARSRFESPRRQFVADTLSSKIHSESFDIAVLSGTLTFKTSDNLATMGSLLENAWRVSKEAVCCNFMTKYCDFQLEKNYHYSPEDVFRHAKSFSQFVNLIHDYELYEFTIQIFHAAAVKRQKRKQ